MKKIFTMLLACTLLVALISCDTPSSQSGASQSSEEGASSEDESSESSEAFTSEEGSAAKTDPEPNCLHVVEDGTAKIPLVYSSRANSTVTAAAETLFSAVAEKTGQFLTGVQDHIAESEYEILIGETNRQESADLQATLLPYQFSIRVTETKLVIAGWNDALLVEGVDYFLSHFLDGERGEMREGTFWVKIGAEYRSDPSDNSVFYESLLASDTLVPGYTEHLFTIAKPSGMTWQQGGCILDGYYYQAFIRKDTASNEANNDVIIVKYDLETEKLVQASDSLQLNHANDITYNSKLGYFVVCHNNPNRTWVSYVDPETLTLVDTVTIEQKIYSIDYNASADRYVVGCSGGQSFRFLDGDLSLLDSNVYQPTSRSADCVTQSVTSDDEYIYFVLYNPNLITVYDWDGNFVTLIEFDVGSTEPESIAIVRNEIYIGCGTSSGTKIYKIGSFVPKED